MSTETGLRREADAAPCEVIVAEFVFAPVRCNRAALYTVPWDGERWRVCAEHARSEAAE